MRYPRAVQGMTGKQLLPMKIDFYVDIDFIANVLCSRHEAYRTDYPKTKKDCMEMIKYYLQEHGKTCMNIENDEEYKHARCVAAYHFPELA